MGDIEKNCATLWQVNSPKSCDKETTQIIENSKPIQILRIYNYCRYNPMQCRQMLTVNVASSLKITKTLNQKYLKLSSTRSLSTSISPVDNARTQCCNAPGSNPTFSTPVSVTHQQQNLNISNKKIKQITKQY